MKKHLVLAVFLSLFFILSCGEETPDEEISDVPDWDFSNVVTDEEANGTDAENNGDGEDFNDASDGENLKNDADSAASEDDEFLTDFDNAGEKSVCGDGKVDYNERCDPAISLKTCSSLNANMTSGATRCFADCKSYDLSSCDKKVWGVLNLHFATNFILNNANIGDPTYFAKGALPYAAFNGIYGDDDAKTFFPIAGEDVVSFASTDDYVGAFGATKRRLFIKQNPVVNGNIGYPRHEIEFPPGGLDVGSDYKINAVSIFDLVDNSLKLARYRLIDKQNGVECIMGIGYSGLVSIVSVFPENENLYEGGTIEIASKDVDFYYPTELPNLDENNPEVSQEILAYPLCSK